MTRRVGGAAAVRLLYDGVINSHYRFVWGGEGAQVERGLFCATVSGVLALAAGDEFDVSAGTFCVWR